MPGAPQDGPPDDRQDDQLVSARVPVRVLGAPQASALAPDDPSGDLQGDPLVSVPVPGVPLDDRRDGCWVARSVYQRAGQPASARVPDVPSVGPRGDY